MGNAFFSLITKDLSKTDSATKALCLDEVRFFFLLMYAFNVLDLKEREHENNLGFCN